VDADQTLTDRDGVLDAAARTFLAAARTATLATIGPSGRPRLVPICFVVGVDDATGRVRVYSPLDEKPKSGADPYALARVRDLLARPQATLLVDRWSEDWDRLAWLRLETRADLLEPGPREADGGARGDLEGATEHGAATTALRAKYPQYAGHRLEDRPILRFTVERAVGWGALGGD
jgi:PPOX class probable F420-dependent enzyme